MFKSLQSIPSTITVFHSTKAPVSSALISLLQKNALTATSTPKPKSFFQRLTSSNSKERPNIFQLDITESIPTTEQYDSIKEAVARSVQNKEAFSKLFPKFGSTGGNLPSSTEYGLKLEHETAGKIFNPPLVVDWDHGLLATDSAGVQEIIDVFQKPAEE